jgi:HK97 family phage portal protein
MGLLASALRADSSWSPVDDRWYQPSLGLFAGGNYPAGLYLTADTIFLCGTVLAAWRWKAEAFAMCPPVVGRRIEGGGRQMMPDHYAQRVLRHPNAKDTGYEWRHQMMLWVSSWGNAYNRIIAGGGTFAAELRPLHPSRVRVLDQSGDGSLIYEYRPWRASEPVEILDQSEVLHYRGLSIDGISGAPMYQLIRNVVGTALAVEQHVGTWLRKGTRLAGLLVPDGPLDDVKRKEMRDSWQSQNGGADKSGTVGVMPFGVKFQPMQGTNREAQLVELNNQMVESILRALGVPGIVVGYQGDKASTYASADAFFEKGGIKHCLQPAIIAFEQREEKALLLESDRDVFIKHNMDALLRSNTKDRYEALAKATGRPWLTGNEARAIEDLNPDPDPSMDKCVMPGNMDMGAEEREERAERAPSMPQRSTTPARPEDDEDAEALLARGWQFALDASARVVRREVAAIRGGGGRLGLAMRYASDPAGWRAALTEFYGKHAEHVAEALHLSAEDAQVYATGQRDVLLAEGVAVVETWENTVPQRLAALAWGE